jgi:hypothetical protein
MGKCGAHAHVSNTSSTMSVSAKLAENLPDSRSGKLTNFTRPDENLPDRTIHKQNEQKCNFWRHIY